MIETGKWMLRVTCAAVGLLAAGPPAAVAGTSQRVGTYGAPFLGIPVGARVQSVPLSVVGASPDASLLFSNSALLGEMTASSQVFLTTANWLDDLRLTALSAVVRPAGGPFTFALGAQFLYSGSIAGVDPNLNVVDQSNSYDLALTGSAIARAGAFSLSVSGRLLREHLLEQNGTGATAGAALAWRSGATLVHFSASDVVGGMRMAGRRLGVDARYRLGVARRVPVSIGRLVVGIDVTADDAGSRNVLAGAEFRPLEPFAVRLGSPDLTGPSEARSGIRGGLGFSTGPLQVDYAYTSRDFFGATHSFSVVYTPGRGAGQPFGPPHSAPAQRAPERFDSQPGVIPSGGREDSEPGELVWIVFAGSFSDHGAAETRRMQLERAGIPCEIDRRASGGYRVVVGRFPRRAEAESLAARYASFGRFGVIAQTTPSGP